MNQDPTGNKPLSSSKPPVYIPPVQRPGRRIKKSGGSSGLPTGRPNSRNCSSGGKKKLRRCRDRWLCLPFRASKHPNTSARILPAASP